MRRRADIEGKRRGAPDWAIGKITFPDPVMVSSLLCSLPEHLRSVNHCGPQRRALPLLGYRYLSPLFPLQPLSIQFPPIHPLPRLHTNSKQMVNIHLQTSVSHPSSFHSGSNIPCFAPALALPDSAASLLKPEHALCRGQRIGHRNQYRVFQLAHVETALARALAISILAGNTLSCLVPDRAELSVDPVWEHSLWIRASDRGRGSGWAQ